ncbi:MAG TPA: hypothetical protein ENG36_00875, partial [Lentisphaerae bacterium]|nr:hypothetical protein [Lentisphaerota bacterium]
MHLPRRACLMLTVLLFSVTFIRFVPAQEKTATTIEFRKLKALLPDSFGKFERTSSSGERSSAFGISVSYAEATYGNDDGGQITIKLTDMGGMPGISAMASGAWASVEMERETDTGFERTTEYKGYKVM